MTPDTSDAEITGPERPRRPPPTIDLEPSEISGDSVRSSDSAKDRAKARWHDHVRLPASAVARSFLVSLAGGALAAVVLMTTMRLAGWPPSNADPQQSALLDDFGSRLSRVESRPAPAAPSNAQASARVESLESSLSSLKDNLAASQKANDSMAASLAELKSTPRPAASAAAPSVDLAPLNERIARLEQSVRSNASSASPTDVRLRRAVAAMALDIRVQQGAPFVDLILSVKQTGIDAPALAAIESFASSGVPDNAALARDLQKLLTQASPASAAKSNASATTGGIIERFTAGAANLVRVDRIDSSAVTATTSGDDRSSLAKVQAAVRGNDVASAQREASRLPDADRAALKPWLDRVTARDAALEASRKLVSTSLSSLAEAPASAPSR